MSKLATHDPVWIRRFRAMTAKELSLRWIEQMEPPTANPEPVQKVVEKQPIKKASRPKRVKATPKDVIRQVSEETGIPVSEILSHRLQKDIVAARHRAIVEVYERCRTVNGARFTLPHIGEIFDRDHSSIFYALQKAGLK